MDSNTNWLSCQDLLKSSVIDVVLLNLVSVEELIFSSGALTLLFLGSIAIVVVTILDNTIGADPAVCIEHPATLATEVVVVTVN